MKRIISILLCAVVILTLPLTIYAAENESDSIFITIVVPQSEKKEETPAPAPPRNYLYPVSVLENNSNGRREIIRTYELNAREKPEDISRESFTRDGWVFELAEITKNETSSNDIRDHTENVSVETATNDMTAILNQLAPNMEFTSNDGYTGVLQLDISSIKVEQAGTRSSSYTVTATREYPHLSSNDTSLVPKSITDNGRTLNLSGIDWRVQNYVTVDYVQIPENYTAVATYTGTASRTTVTGYVTTAEYRGAISKILTGKTVYTAHFIGTQIVTLIEIGSEVTEIPTQEDVTEAESEIISEPDITELPMQIVVIEPETAETTAINSESETQIQDEPETETEETQDAYNFIPVILAVLAGILFGGGFVLLYLKKIRKNGGKILNEEIN